MSDQQHTEIDAWWVINNVELLAALHRAADGDDPDLVYVELFANSEEASDG